MSYLGLIDTRTAAKVTTAPATTTTTTQPKTLLATKMTTYAQVKPTVQQTVVKPTVTVQPTPETTVMVAPPNAVGMDKPSGGEVEITTTQSAPPAAEVQTTVQAATKTNWLPWALGAAGLLWFYKKK
jgi:hypothetical protein